MNFAEARIASELTDDNIRRPMLSFWLTGANEAATDWYRRQKYIHNTACQKNTGLI